MSPRSPRCSEPPMCAAQRNAWPSCSPSPALENLMTTNHELFQRALPLMPGGVNSPVRAFKSVGGEPFFTERADGAYLWDVEGKRYIDYVGSWGPMIVCHNHPVVREAVERAVRNGLSFGTPCAAEVSMAETITRLVPSVEMVRMVNSGTEATMSAIRLARGTNPGQVVPVTARVVRGRRVSETVRAMVVPGSMSVKAAAEKEGLDRVFQEAGFEWRDAGC